VVHSGCTFMTNSNLGGRTPLSNPQLREYANVRQIEGEPKRRWFGNDANLELIVWHEHGKVIGFQLCYDLETDEHALTWWADGSYWHNRIDAGDTVPGKDATPILTADGTFDRTRVAAEFSEASRAIDPEIRNIVQSVLGGHA